MNQLNANIETLIERGEFVDSFYDKWTTLRNQIVDPTQLLKQIENDQ